MNQKPWNVLVTDKGWTSVNIIADRCQKTRREIRLVFHEGDVEHKFKCPFCKEEVTSFCGHHLGKREFK